MTRDEEEGWRELLAVLDRVPFVSGLKRDIASLGALVYERRAPRIMVLGGASTDRDELAGVLVGASTTKPGWGVIESDGRTIEWIGLDVAADLRPALDDRRPDAVILLASAEEVDQGLGHHLGALTKALAHDEATPASFALVEGASSGVREKLERQLNEASLTTTTVIQNTTALAEALVTALPEPAQVEGARAFRHAVASRRSVASAVVRCCSTLAITVAITPLPLSDIAILAPLQAMMVTTLAYLSGREWDRKTAGEWVTSVGVVGGAGLGMRWGAQQVVKLIPGMGSIASAAIAGAGTLAVGRSALKYFMDEVAP